MDKQPFPPLYSEGCEKMTDFEKEKIQELRQQGFNSSKIAEELGLKSSSVRSYCSRNSVEAPTCPQCGAVVLQSPHRKAKRFCSAKCRMDWWNHHTDLKNRKPHHTQICPICHRTIKCYKAEPRKYCSRSCYAQARRKAANNNG